MTDESKLEEINFIVSEFLKKTRPAEIVEMNSVPGITIRYNYSSIFVSEEDDLIKVEIVSIEDDDHFSQQSWYLERLSLSLLLACLGKL